MVQKKHFRGAQSEDTPWVKLLLQLCINIQETSAKFLCRTFTPLHCSAQKVIEFVTMFWLTGFVKYLKFVLFVITHYKTPFDNLPAVKAMTLHSSKESQY